MDVAEELRIGGGPREDSGLEAEGKRAGGRGGSVATVGRRVLAGSGGLLDGRLGLVAAVAGAQGGLLAGG